MGIPLKISRLDSYSTLESYSQVEFNSICYKVWGESSMKNVIDYYKVPLPAETDISGTLASIWSGLKVFGWVFLVGLVGLSYFLWWNGPVGLYIM